MERLVEGKAGINAEDLNGNTPLDFASVKGHSRICVFLRQLGARERSN